MSNYALFPPEDAVDSQLQQRKIDVLYVELDDIRLSPYDSADPAQAKAWSTAYQGKMSEIENMERALRAFHKEARQNFTNFTAARNSASFPPDTASGRNVSSTSKSTMKLWDDPKRAGPFTNNPEKPIYHLREEKGYCTCCGIDNHKEDKCRTYSRCQKLDSRVIMYL
ncbi:hypothetical protein SeLEV6574_g07007 [Synchytrium endobioticum]|uniref:Uncharacterized protein n=1 Tax=Synchytrium endobioticum TaxID=286115 RepID=A0A507CJQ6_9FUNG|nr:hypothetical protein SeLEV6574_g07007 [Synchytrium endobioticum]